MNLVEHLGLVRLVEDLLESVESDGRTWVAGSLEQYLQRWFDGTLDA